ncbi:hypothetical protein FBEOM_4514 [Fusarium beomiforme]|uniref:Uncharacterized protein n=1 Tax=Fusarium beomiforme TaxID=44412 RepID=A0A9P5AMZ3_9HYPO|nr:hypothetical protein FBEOM_4514 [Fusarium beomiforme]
MVALKLFISLGAIYGALANPTKPSEVESDDEKLGYYTYNKDPETGRPMREYLPTPLRHEWWCRDGKGAKDEHLVEAVEIFDALYGKEPLRLKPSSIAVAVCYGYYFAWKNDAGVPLTENVANRRKMQAVHLPKGKGSRCSADMRSNLRSRRDTYMFGKVKDFGWLDRQDFWALAQRDIRHCGIRPKQEFAGGSLLPKVPVYWKDPRKADKEYEHED